jgi:putative CocE/NonD family hydrolase
MRIVSELPRPVRVVPNLWIPLSDGCRLAARVWLPEDAERDPVPAILEYLPYRKSDGTAERDAPRHSYLAGHGYAVLRVDLRGTGDSDGILLDEYLPQEQDDALEVLRWIAAQPWCSGRIGMFGISWGGFNGLQVAARRPPELHGVITLCSTDDRYADDVHYMGGCVLGYDMLAWASTMLGQNAKPPDPEVVGGRWRELWLERLERTPAYIEAWLGHQHRDAYWKHGSVCEDLTAITCPVLAVGGWADGYRNAVLRLVRGLPGRCKGLIGPWSHAFPEEGVPGPAIGFLQECLRFYDWSLRGLDSGYAEDVALRAWMQEPVAPRGFYAKRPGRWVAEDAWPAPAIGERRLHLAPRGLEREPGEAAELQHRGSLLCGLESGQWCPWGDPADLPPDQRGEDGLSLSFDSPPLAERIEILGNPTLTLALRSDRPSAMLAVRLCDVAPDGASTLVTRGLLNLCHRGSHEHPQPLEPGRREVVRVELVAIAHAFVPGHRVRVALSPTYWPFAWPSPEPVTLTVETGAASYLSLPERPPRASDGELRAFAEPELGPRLPVEVLATDPGWRRISRDLATGRVTLTAHEDFGGHRRLLETGGSGWDENTIELEIVDGDPLSARVRSRWSVRLERGEWRTRVDTVSTMTADASSFLVTNAIDAYEGDVRVFARAWSFETPRRLV